MDTVLVSAGIELIFFLVAGMGLCFGFRMRTVLMFWFSPSSAKYLLSGAHAGRGLFSFPRSAGCARNWGRARLGQLTRIGYSVPSDVMLGL